MHMYERPLTQKVTIGDEPISNTVWGADGNYRKDSRFITKLLDKLPFYSTKEISTLTFSGEFAQLIPGHSQAVGSQREEHEYGGNNASQDDGGTGMDPIDATPQLGTGRGLQRGNLRNANFRGHGGEPGRFSKSYTNQRCSAVRTEDRPLFYRLTTAITGIFHSFQKYRRRPGVARRQQIRWCHRCWFAPVPERTYIPCPAVRLRRRADSSWCRFSTQHWSPRRHRRKEIRSQSGLDF